MDTLISFLQTAIIFVGILGIVVIAHELGHFLTAKYLGMRVEEFGFGIPPRICGIKKVKGKWKFFWGKKIPEKKNIDNTIYSLNWIPLGGFNNITGENGDEEKDSGKKDPKSFASKKIWKRAVVLSAGVIMNLIVGILATTIAFWAGSPPLYPRENENNTPYNAESGIIFVEIEEDSPAERAGLKVQDKVLKIDGEKLLYSSDFSELIKGKEGKEVTLTIKRDQKLIEEILIPEYNEENEKTQVGVYLNPLPHYNYNNWKVPFYATAEVFGFVWFLPQEVANQMNMWFNKEVEDLPVTGIVGVAVLTGYAKDYGFIMIMNLLINITLALAFFNILPLPALDGSRLVFLLLEKIRGKPVDAKIENTVHGIGLLVFLLLGLLITVSDISRFADVLMFWK